MAATAFGRPGRLPQLPRQFRTARLAVPSPHQDSRTLPRHFEPLYVTDADGELHDDLIGDAASLLPPSGAKRHDDSHL
jgi:hypothetical protein